MKTNRDKDWGYGTDPGITQTGIHRDKSVQVVQL